MRSTGMISTVNLLIMHSHFEMENAMSRKTLQVLLLLHLKKVFTISSAIKIWYCITYVEAYMYAWPSGEVFRDYK